MSRLSGNTLKILAALSMLIDHVGLMFFPRVPFLRVLGRLALPIYAFMIAEGCKYTRNRKRYFLTLFLLAAVCQSVYYFVDGTLYFSILVTFSLSVLMVYALDAVKGVPGPVTVLALVSAVAAVYVLNQRFTIDYGFWGCMLPVFASVFHKTKYDRIPLNVAMLGIGLLFLALDFGGNQWFALLSLPLLLCYSGKRGNWSMKYFFYIFYPAHLVILQAIAWLMA